VTHRWTVSPNRADAAVYCDGRMVALADDREVAERIVVTCNAAEDMAAKIAADTRVVAALRELLLSRGKIADADAGNNCSQTALERYNAAWQNAYQALKVEAPA
jgi:hypothetical protein